jgi:hypothetical protein
LVIVNQQDTYRPARILSHQPTVRSRQADVGHGLASEPAAGRHSSVARRLVGRDPLAGRG